jgi:type II secretory pathway pseudopilin PulG
VTRSSKRAGYTLLEMMTVIWMLSVVLGLGMALLLTAMRADKVGEATLRQLTRHAELADQFRADVAAAVEAPDRLGEFTAGPACLILRNAGGPVIYNWHDGKLDRTDRTSGTETRRPIAMASENTKVEFIRPAGEWPILTVRVIETSPRGLHRQMEVSAALGGDTR